MAKSRIGFDLNADLGEWSDGDGDEAPGGDGGELEGSHRRDDAAGGEDDDSDDDGMFSSTALQEAKVKHGLGDNLGISVGRSLLQQTKERGGFDMNFLSTDPHATLCTPELEDYASRPTLVNLPISSFSPGTHVWVADANDVVTILRTRWENRMLSVCNGRAMGVVLRISGDLITCKFAKDSEGVEPTFGFPRACLFLEALAPYESRFEASSSKILTDGGGLGPRAGHDKKVPIPKFGLLAPLDRCLAVGSPCSTTEDVLTALESDNLQAARNAIERREAKWQAMPRSPTPPPVHTAASSATKLAVSTSSPGPQPPVDVVTAHCTALIDMALGNPAKADAICTKARNAYGSGNITLYMRAWHAKLMVGQFAAAQELINHASLLCPHEPILDVASSITDAMKQHEAGLKALDNPLTTTMSYRFERRILSQRYFVPGDVVACDEALLTVRALDTPRNAMPMCDYCMSTTKPAPTFKAPRGSKAAIYCDDACAAKAWDEYGEFEDLHHLLPFRSARFLIDQRRESEQFKPQSEGPLLESAVTSLRVVARLGSALMKLDPTAEDVDVQAAALLRRHLLEMGLYPAPDGVTFAGLSVNVEYQMTAIHRVVTSKFPPLLKRALEFGTFRSIVAAIHTYRKRITVPLGSTGAGMELNIVTRASGCVTIAQPRPEHGNVRLEADDEGNLILIATDVIDPRGEITCVQ